MTRPRDLRRGQVDLGDFAFSSQKTSRVVGTLSAHLSLERRRGICDEDC